MVDSKLNPRNLKRPAPSEPCDSTFPGEPGTKCEGRLGHDGDCFARVTVTWKKPAPPQQETPPCPTPPAS